MSSSRGVLAALVAALCALAFGAVRAAKADPPSRVSNTFDVTFKSSTWTRRCGFPVFEHQTGKVTNTVYSADGTVTKEIDTADGLKTTYFSANGSYTSVSSATLHTTYPDGIALGAPATLVFTGNQVLLPGSPQAGRDAYAGEVVFVSPDGTPFVDIDAPISEHGHFDSFPDEIAALCGALS